MKRRAYFVAWCLLWIMLIARDTAHSRELRAKTTIVPSGSTTVSAEMGKKTANVTIHTARPEGGFPLSTESGGKAVTVVQSLSISIDGNDLFVPRSIFADLLDPREASLRSQKGVFVLSISGGDGAESYFIRVYFDLTKVKRRMLYSSLTPDRPSEDTQYRLEILKDE